MRLLTIARKEFRDVMREKSLVTAFVIQLFLAGFSALLLVGLTALHSPETLDAAPDTTIAYIGDGGFDAYLMDARNIDVLDMAADEAIDAFRAGRVGAIIQEQARDPGGVHDITLILPDGELQSTLLVTQLKSLLIDYENDLRQSRTHRLEISYLPEPIDVRAETPYGFVYATLIPLLVITPVFLSGAIAGDALSQESRSRTLLILRSTPVSTSTLVLGKLVVPVLLVPIQVAVWLFLFGLNGFPATDPWVVIAFATTLGVFLTGTGGIIAAMIRDESTTQAAYAIFVLGIAVFSLLLPRDPLNVIAMLVTGVPDVLAWQTVGILIAASAAGLAAAIWLTGRRIRHDLL